MTILVTIQAQLIVGEAQVIKSLAPEGMLAAVFEDDGQTGYFYALDESVEGTRFRMQCISTMSRIFQTATFLLTLKSAGQKTVRSACSLSTDIRMECSISLGKMGTAEVDFLPR
jgi:hypothetical protein